MSSINLSPQLSLIDVNDIAVEVVGVIAQRKKGKTYTGTKLFEELFHADVQCVAIDQVGNWHYLRNSSTGRGAGLPGIRREEIAKSVGMALGSGGFNNYMGALTSAGLIKKEAPHLHLYVAADEFYR
jgi:hypothetical protein